MNSKLIIIILSLVLTCSAYAQTQRVNNNVGDNFLIKSEVLNQEREIQIFLPQTYQESDKKYAVLFVLDGQRYFLHAISLQKSFVEFRQTPEFIVVGITKKESERNRNFSSDSEEFLSFIEQEVIEFVDSNYRTSKTRLLFGWAYAGGFAIQAMTDKPNLFDAYIAASPFPASEKISVVDSLLTKNPNFDKFLYFTSDVSEGEVKDGTEALSALLTNKAPKSMRWSFRAFNGEEHRSTPFSTLYHGIAKYFVYYPELQFNSLEEFLNAGGLDYVYEYYQKRALQFGFSNDLSDWTMFSLTRNAIRANDFEQFELLMDEFIPTEFMSRLRVNRACTIAEFYFKNKQNDKAVDLFSLLAEKHPNAARPLNGLGDTYNELKQNAKANRFYRKAKELSTKNSN